MKHNVEKTPKVALCRACHGTGVIQRTTELPSRIFRKKKVNKGVSDGKATRSKL